ncbi:secretion/DNA translocation related TadE-like protein [Prauserella shujinwangii]|uniref:Secretion/DNA translocation related TadE-like protein n=1 Tax=Prauserella shujinwangii TaxID=1453103 RepID=A0A2T0M1T2_9PSEU|nr:Rv3654c family TadE-like protein [Prauserella shujinwangii]PRX50548.1 secretion/DNA translocation related TadE-like protein [Prauserella shujinwangii]
MPTRDESGQGGRDAGLATVWAAGAVAALLLVGCLLWWLGAAVATRHRAAGVADLAALAAAGHASAGPAGACGRARMVTERMRVSLRECRFAGWDALVVVEARPAGPLGGFGTVIARARAGPVE